MAKPKFHERVIVASAEIRPLRVILTILAVPFYLLGFVLGLTLVAVLWAAGAVKVGVGDARARLERQPEPPVVDDTPDGTRTVLARMAGD